MELLDMKKNTKFYQDIGKSQQSLPRQDLNWKMLIHHQFRKPQKQRVIELQCSTMTVKSDLF